MKSKTALPPTGLVARYEQAYNHVVDKLPAWKKTIIVNHEDDDAFGNEFLLR